MAEVQRAVRAVKDPVAPPVLRVVKTVLASLAALGIATGAVAFFWPAKAEAGCCSPGMATCSPVGVCRACSNCKYCANCSKYGGTCSVCRP